MRREKTEAFFFLTAFLLIAYFPAIQGYYLMNDDYWGFLYDYDRLTANPMFHTQAMKAGRPLGALGMSFLQSFLNHVSDANGVRAFLILLLSSVAFCFYGWLRKMNISHLRAILFSTAVFTLPCFHSAIACITDSYSIYGLFPTIAAAMLAWKIISDAPSPAGTIAYGLTATLLLFISLMTYPFTAMFYWVLLAVPLAGWDLSAFRAKKRALLLCLGIPFVAMALYLAYFRLTQSIESSSRVSTNLFGRFLWFIHHPLPRALSLWERPSQFDVTLTDVYRSSRTAWVSTFLILAGLCAAGIREMSARPPSVSLRKGIFLLLQKYGLLACLFFLTMTPLLASTWPGLSYHYLIALMPLILLALVWSVSRISAFIVHPKKELLLTLGLAALSLGSVFIAHRNIANEVTLPLTTELQYFKEVLRPHNLSQTNRIHVIRSGRQFSSFEAMGFQSTFGPHGGEWSPGLVLTAIRELAREDRRFEEAARQWTVGRAFDAVTSSTKEDFEKGKIILDPKQTLLIDVTQIEFLIDPWVRYDSQAWLSYEPKQAAGPHEAGTR